jgi:hypothetical protein
MGRHAPFIGEIIAERVARAMRSVIETLHTASLPQCDAPNVRIAKIFL